MAASNKKLIAKNTSILSIQMLMSMVVGLYTGRIVLSTLGAVDYGVYCVVGGVITTLSFFSNALAASSSRFIVYDLGAGDMSALKKTVSNIMAVHITLAVIVLLIAETIGIWFVKTQLVIPEERIFAAIWAYQFSVFSFIMSILSAPYNGMLMAHEQFTIYAAVNVVNLILKLLVVFVIIYMSFDKLILYAFLILCVDIANRLYYGIYCSRHFEEARSGLSLNKVQYKKILYFSGWMCVGNFATMCNNQGFNILLNMFFGPIVNAAYGMAIMVIGQVSSFGLQLQVSTRPQIIKSFAEGNYNQMQSLMFMGAKFSFFILLAIALPTVMEIHQFLNWWLAEVPEWTVQFVIVFVCISLIQIIGVSMYNGALACGYIKNYQILQSVVMISFLPVTYLLLRFSKVSPLYPFCMLFVFNIISEGLIAFMMLRRLKISIISYLKEVLLPIMKVLVLSSIVPMVMRINMGDGLFPFLSICSVAFCCVIVSSLYVGCNYNERHLLVSWCRNKLFKK